jgi:uncharacterized membrane protein YidH (DUF202 family)
MWGLYILAGGFGLAALALFFASIFVRNTMASRFMIVGFVVCLALAWLMAWLPG